MLQAALNHLRVRFGSTPLVVGSVPRAVPNIGCGPATCSVVPSADATAVSPETAIIGSTNLELANIERRPTATVVPIIGTKHGRGHSHAAAFAAEFLAWLADQPEATMMLPDEVVIDMAANQFAPVAGMPMPPSRNLLSALKRSPGVRVKPNVRVRDARGDVIGKTTMYVLIAELPSPSRIAA